MFGLTYAPFLLYRRLAAFNSSILGFSSLVRWRSEQMRPYQDHPEYALILRMLPFPPNRRNYSSVTLLHPTQTSISIHLEPTPALVHTPSIRRHYFKLGSRALVQLGFLDRPTRLAKQDVPQDVSAVSGTGRIFHFCCHGN